MFQMCAWLNASELPIPVLGPSLKYRVALETWQLSGKTTSRD